MNEEKQQVGFWLDYKDLEIIDKAAEQQKRSRSNFLISSAVKEAKRELNE